MVNYLTYVKVRKTEVTAPPATTPVTLDQVKANSRILHDDQDVMINGHIDVAIRMVEQILERALITRTLTGYLDMLHAQIWLPFPPLISVASVEYTDHNGDLQVADPELYTADHLSEPGRILLKSDAQWPTHKRAVNSVRITYDAGFGPTSADVPPDIRQVILASATAIYDNPAVLSPTGKSYDSQQLYNTIAGMNRMYI